MAVIPFQATFTGASDSVVVSWTARPGNYRVLLSQPVVTDGGSTVSVALYSVGVIGATVTASEKFTGTVSGVVVDVP